MKKWIAVIVLIIIVIIGYNYVYQDHRDIGNESADYTLAAKTIADEFANDSQKSQEKYLNKTIVVTGTISEHTENAITLNSSVFCQFMDSIKSPIKKDIKIKIKGRVIGYDDLLEQVKLDQCTLIEY